MIVADNNDDNYYVNNINNDNCYNECSGNYNVNDNDNDDDNSDKMMVRMSTR